MVTFQAATPDLIMRDVPRAVAFKPGQRPVNTVATARILSVLRTVPGPLRLYGGPFVSNY
jgi:hypothetical protein